MEVGIDIEENERFKNLKPSFISRTYTKNEIEYAEHSSNQCEKWCSIWCVKEAVIKALSNKKLKSIDIEVLHKEDGKPYVAQNETIEKALKKCGASELKISISHSKNYSTAICIIY